MTIEEAAEHYASVTDPEAHGIDFIREVFIAGAEWQKEQDTRDMFMSDNRHFEKVYELGKKDMKEQMMKEAVEGVVTNADSMFGYDVAAFRFDDNHTYSVLLPHEEKRKYGDKVRLIIVKED